MTEFREDPKYESDLPADVVASDQPTLPCCDFASVLPAAAGHNGVPDAN